MPKRRIALKIRRLYTVLIVCLLISVLVIAMSLWRYFPSVVSCLAQVAVLILVAPVIPIVVFRWFPPPTSAFMIQTRANLRRAGKPDIVYQWVNFQQIIPDMCLATIIAEDFAFPIHYGFDWRSLQRAHMLNKQIKDREFKRGGSTITQQLVKNLFLWSARSYLRKGIEFYITLLIESLWSKRRILEVYLNIVQFGENIFGVESAAQCFFGKHASTLTSQECTLLAAVLPNPMMYQVAHPSHQVKFRQAMILNGIKKMSPQYLDFIKGEGLLSNSQMTEFNDKNH